jgi:hypothetical protein
LAGRNFDGPAFLSLAALPKLLKHVVKRYEKCAHSGNSGRHDDGDQ